MPLPEALQGETWTRITARAALPILVWCAKNGRTITYGQLDQEIVRRGLGHHVHAAAYGYPAGAIGNALFETEENWGEAIPPLNAIIVNSRNGMPGTGVDYYLERYFEPEDDIKSMTEDARRAVVEEIHADIFAYEFWDSIIEEYGLLPIPDGVATDEEGINDIDPPRRGGWSSEEESIEHRTLKEYIAAHPDQVGLPHETEHGITEYLFASGDRADVVFKTCHGYLGVEIKSIISNDADFNKGLFQAIKYQALLRAEQKALLQPPTARAILVTERRLPAHLQNLADAIGIGVFVVLGVNNA